MSEAKSKGRPTLAEAATDQVAAESFAEYLGEAVVDRAGARSAARSVKDVVVTVRMTADDADALAYIQAELGSASSPDAVREAIRNVAANMRGQTYRSGKAQRPSVNADKALLEDIREAIDGVTKSYNARTREVHYVGHNWNQIAKVANATGTADVDAMRGIERELSAIRIQMAKDAKRDTKALEVLRCLL